MSELKLGLAMYCCRVKQGCPLIALGQEVSAVGMILILSHLAYWTVVFKRSKIVSFEKKMYISISIHTSWF